MAYLILFLFAAQQIQASVGLFSNQTHRLVEEPILAKDFLEELAVELAASIPDRPATRGNDYKFSSGGFNCQTDHGALCPDGFVLLPQSQSCLAGQDYEGPCSERAYDFHTLSIRAKRRWSELCLASWPCIWCERDFSKPCPDGWRQTAGGTCEAAVEYDGPCSPNADLSGFNAAMLEQWSSHCGAYWSCKR